MAVLTLCSVCRPVFLCTVCTGIGVLLCTCRMRQAESVPGGAAGLPAVQAPVSVGKESGEGAAVVLNDARRAEQEARLKKVLKSLPPFMLHEGSVEEFCRDVDAWLVRFREDGAPWYDWAGDGARPEFRAVLENGGRRLRIAFFHHGLDNVFGTSEEVYEWKDGSWVAVSEEDCTYAVPDGRGPDDGLVREQGRLFVESSFRCLLKCEDGDRYLEWERIPPELLQKMRCPDGSYAPAWVHVRVKPPGVQGSKEWGVEKVYGLSMEKDRPSWFR